MSTTIDERVVSMKFNGQQFQSGISDSLNSINNLKKGLNFEGATKGLDNLSTSANKVNFNGLSSGLEAIQVKFSALQVVALTALSNIANSAINTGKQLISSLTIDPIKQGFKEYETQMNAIQTIMANTSSKGTTLNEVSAALDELNTYADKTIYNFTEMTKNIGTFTAAGIDLKTSTAAIKGIANLAAVSGSTSEQASTAMYQLSQALASGTVKLMDWNSVVNAGMGGEVFQTALKDTARVHGVAIDDMIKNEGSFRETLQKGWLTSSILTETLSKFTGDLNAEQLKSMGYTEDQIKGILKMGVTAYDAATKVKTATQLIDTMKEAVGSGWAKTWQIVFGDFEEAKLMFTDVSNVLGGIIGASSDARNEMLKGWKDLGGRTALIEGIKNAFDGVMGVVGALSGAFRDIFPATTSAQLMSLTEGFKNFTENLKLSDTTLNNLRSTFKGVFAVVDIVKQVFLGLVGGFSTIISGSDKLGSSLLSMTASFGEWLTALDNTIKSSGVINTVIQSLAQNIRNAFDGTGKTLEYFGIKFAEVRDAIVSQINFDPWTSFSNVLINIGKAVGTVCDKISELQGKLSDMLTSFGEKFNGIDIGPTIQKMFQGVSKLLVGNTEEVKKSTDTMESSFTTSINNFVKNIGGISLAAIGFALTKLVSNIANIFKSKGNIGSIFDGLKASLDKGMGSVTGALDGVRGCLKSYQDQLKAGILMKISIAIGILAASIVAISMIDSGKLVTSLAAIGGLFAQLLVAMKVFSLIGEFKVAAIKSAIVMTAMSTSMLILANAMRVIGQLDVKQTITALGAIVVLMAMMTGVIKVLSKDSGTFVKGAIGIIAFAEAIKMLGDACANIGKLDYEVIKKGLMGIGIIMAELAVFLKTDPSIGLKTAASILILSVALNNMYYAVKNIGSLDWENIKKGLMGIGGVLLEVAAFDKLTSNAKNVIATSVSLVIISVALNKMGTALSGVGSLDWEVIKKGLIGMGLALAEIALFSNLMSNAKDVIVTSASLVIVAYALKELSIPLSEIGNLDWEVIKKGLIGMGGALAEITIFNQISSSAKGTIVSTISLGIAVSALSVLAKDLQIFGNLSWEQIKKGLVGMGGALLEIVIMMNSLNKYTPVNALALIEICTALNILTKAFSGFAGLSWEGIAKGLVATGAALGVISLGMKKLPADSVFTALGLTGVASALVIMTQALIPLSGLSWEGIAKGLVAIGGSIAVLSAGVKLLNGSLSGVAALILVAGALNLLVPPILQLSTLSWEGLLISLTTLAGVMAVMGVAAGVLAPVIPAMFGLSGALFVLGIALVGIGAGIALATLGFAQLSQAFTTLDGTTKESADSVSLAMTAMVVGIANGIPTLVTKIGEGVKIILQYLTNAIPAFTDFVLKAIIAMTESIAQNAPLIMDNVLKTLSSILDELIKWIPTISQKVVDIILSLLKIIADNITKFTTAAIDIIVGFIKGITYSLPKIIDAGINLIVTFINGLADGIRNNTDAIGAACLNLTMAIVDGIGKLNDKFVEAGAYAVKGFINGLISMPGKVASAAGDLGRSALNAAKKALNEHSPSKAFHQIGAYGGEGFVNGLASWGAKVSDASYNMGTKAIDSMSKAIAGISDIVNSDIDSQPVIRPVMDLTDIQNGSKQLYGMMGNLDNYGIDGSVSRAATVAKSISSRQLLNDNTDNISKSNTKNSKNVSKQPATIQLMLQNGRAIAEYIVDDVDDLLGSKNIITGRMVGV